MRKAAVALDLISIHMQRLCGWIIHAPTTPGCTISIYMPLQSCYSIRSVHTYGHQIVRPGDLLPMDIKSGIRFDIIYAPTEACFCPSLKWQNPPCARSISGHSYLLVTRSTVHPCFPPTHPEPADGRLHHPGVVLHRPGPR